MNLLVPNIRIVNSKLVSLLQNFCPTVLISVMLIANKLVELHCGAKKCSLKSKSIVLFCQYKCIYQSGDGFHYLKNLLFTISEAASVIKAQTINIAKTSCTNKVQYLIRVRLIPRNEYTVKKKALQTPTVAYMERKS